MEMRSMKRDLMLMLPGALFLFEPYVSARDVLPDLIGYLLLFLGSARMADLNDDVAEAQNGFRNMLWVGFSRIAAVLFLENVLKDPELTLNRYEQPVWILIFAFVFAVLELWFMLPAWRSFFRGLGAMAELGGGSSLLSERHGRAAWERMLGLTRWFVILRAVLAVLPEASVLTSFEMDAENPKFTFDWYAYVDTFRMVAAMLALAIGMIWLIRYLWLIGASSREERWLEGMERRYASEILPNVSLLLGRRIGTGFTFLRIGMIFSVNVAISNYQFLPDWTCALLFLCAGLILWELLRGPRLWAICGGALLAVGTVRSYFNAAYLEQYVPKDAWYLPRAYEAYLPVRILGWGEAILCCVLLLFTLLLLYRMAEENVSVSYGHGAEALSARATERAMRALRRRAVISAALVGLSAVAKLLEAELRYALDWFWLLQVAVSVVAWIVFSGFLTELSEALTEGLHSRSQKSIN